ncbi:MAG: hypothetical protein KUL87_15835 [Pseudomonas sp.]|nr:hypothetical protein [Pseudomonas sp.]
MYPTQHPQRVLPHNEVRARPPQALVLGPATGRVGMGEVSRTAFRSAK